MKRYRSIKIAAAGLLGMTALGTHPAFAQTNRYDALADLPFQNDRPTAATAKTLMDELFFERAVQSYLWAMPLINTLGMEDGLQAAFGTGEYNVMPIWTKRLSARTQITTPNSDLIYAMDFVNLGKTGPLVFEVPPMLQGILLDAWQRPIPEDSGKFAGDVGLPGPDKGKGGKFLILPPGYNKPVPEGYYVYRSDTNTLFIFLRSFYKDEKNLAPAVDLIKQSKLYPLGQEASAKPMVFPDASGQDLKLLPRTDATAFAQLQGLVDVEGSHLGSPDWLGMLAAIGIAPGQNFAPDAATRHLLDDAATTAYKMSRVIGFQTVVDNSSFVVYPGLHWLNPINNAAPPPADKKPDLAFAIPAQGYRALDRRIWFFTNYYSISPGMVSQIPGQGAFYAIAFVDSKGQDLSGDHSYSLHLPPDVPAKLFWSLTLYDAANGTGLANGQPFPSLGKLDHPVQNSDGSTDLYIGPKAPPGKDANWLATVPGKGFFAILRLYAPLEPALNHDWKPGDLVKTD